MGVSAGRVGKLVIPPRIEKPESMRPEGDPEIQQLAERSSFVIFRVVALHRRCLKMLRPSGNLMCVHNYFAGQPAAAVCRSPPFPNKSSIFDRGIKISVGL